MREPSGKPVIDLRVRWIAVICLTFAGTLLLTGRTVLLSSGKAALLNQGRCPDCDGDGHIARASGGDDCDDRDPRRYPGNAEVCFFINGESFDGRDEDCDPTTFSNATLRDGDKDKDGEVDYRCFNRSADNSINRGTDFDDSNPAIRLGSMICDGPDRVVISGSYLPPVRCPSATKCVAQPNGTGVCMAEPPGYGAPKPFAMFVIPPAPAPAGTAARIMTPDKAGAIVRGPVSPVSGDQPAMCKDTLRSGTVSWGGSTTWAATNIDALCNGTKNAKETIACFESNVKALGWEKAIANCK